MKNLSMKTTKDSLLQAFKPRNYKKLSNSVLSKLKEVFKKTTIPIENPLKDSLKNYRKHFL